MTHRPEQTGDVAVSETTPLLLSGDATTAPATDTAPSSNGTIAEDDPSGPGKDAPEKPLPWVQILLLCYARMMEPVAFFSIFPYIAEMVHRVGDVPQTDVGFYSGLIESLFSAVQMLVLVGWGRLADRVGRKPVLLYSFVGMVVSPALFGLSTSLWQMILFRCLAGVFSGSGLVIRTMISEHSTPDTQAQAFSWFAFGSNISIFIGPLIGGALADPVTQYPALFGGNAFLTRYPYALAGFAVAALASTAFVTSALFLEETLDAGDDGKEDGQTPKKADVGLWEICKAPGVAIVLWVYNHIMVLAFAFTAILPVALYTPVHLGGLGFGPSAISVIMSIQGASQAAWLLLVFPLVQRRLGTKGVMRICAVAYPFFFASYIVLSCLRRDAGNKVSEVLFYMLGIVAAVVGPGVSMCFTAAQLAVNDVAPDHHILGTLNAIALTVTSATRSVVPGIATAIFAVGIKSQILWGHLVWFILIPLAVAYAVTVKWLPEGKQPHRPTENGQDAS